MFTEMFKPGTGPRCTLDASASPPSDSEDGQTKYNMFFLAFNLPSADTNEANSAAILEAIGYFYIKFKADIEFSPKSIDCAHIFMEKRKEKQGLFCRQRI